MRNLVLVFVVIVIFACLLTGITQPPQSEVPPSNPAQGTGIGDSGTKMLEHLQHFFAEFEQFTLNVENAITVEKNTFIMTVLGVVKLVCLMVVLGVIPVAGVASGRSRRRRDL